MPGGHPEKKSGLASRASNPSGKLTPTLCTDQATRGFAPEAANLWALESFPTEERATCYAILNLVYQTVATIIVPATSSLQDWDPALLLVGYAAIQIALGIFTHFLPKETALHALDESADESNPLLSRSARSSLVGPSQAKEPLVAQRGVR